jgi:hypothetical protein
MGKKNYNAIKNDRQKLEPLVHHLEYLTNLGEVRATRVVSTLVNGRIQVRNCEDEATASEVTYLPISMGYRQCYRRYMASLGYRAETDGTGAWAIDSGEYVSYTAYYAKWLWDYPNLKVSKPV